MMLKSPGKISKLRIEVSVGRIRAASAIAGFGDWVTQSSLHAPLRLIQIPVPAFSSDGSGEV
jgi:hypothetical protein